jgi:hypothetical protein
MTEYSAGFLDATIWVTAWWWSAAGVTVFFMHRNGRIKF